MDPSASGSVMAGEKTSSAMNRRQFLSNSALLTAGILGSGPLLSACGESASSQKSGELEVGVLYKEGSPFYDAYRRIADQVEHKHEGATLNLVFANTEARPKLQLRWKNGNPPDVDYVFNAGDRTSLHYAREGQLLDLTSRMQDTDWGDGRSWSDALLPAFRHFAQYEDKYFMAPDEAVVIGLYYNGQMFDDMGLEPPASWDDLMRVSSAIRSSGVSPIAVAGTFEPYMGLWWDYLLLREVGPEAVMDVVYGKNGKLSDHEGAHTAATKLADLVQAKGFLDDFQGIDFTAAQAAFFQGKAAMILMGSWLQGEMKASIPEDFDLRITNFPLVPQGRGEAEGLFGTVLGESVWKKTNQPDAAVEYLRLSTAKDEQAKRVKEQGIVSPYDGEPGPPGVAGMEQLVEMAKSNPVTYYYYGISQDEKLNPAWYGPVAKLFFGKSTPAQMVSQIDSNLARAGG